MLDASYTTRLKDGIHTSIHVAEDLLHEMMTRTQPLPGYTQIEMHVINIRRMKSLTLRISNDLHNIDLEEEDDASNEEPNNLGNTIIDIGRRAFEFYRDLSAREESILITNNALLHAIESAQEGEERRRKSTIMRANLHLGNIDFACDQLYRHYLKAEDYNAAK